MKKLVIFLGLILITANSAFADCPYCTKCVTPQKKHLSLGITRFFSTATGITFASEKAAEGIIRKELKKETGAKFDVHLKAYSATDLLKGRFKSLDITGKNIIVDDNYVSYVNVKTVCEYNSINYKAKPMKFNENMVLNFNLQLSDDDLKNTFVHGGLLDRINKINLAGFGVSFFKVDDSSIDIKNNKLYFKVRASMFGVKKPIEIAICTDLKIEDGKIVTSKVDLVNLFTVVDLKDYLFLLNSIDPLTFKINILSNAKSELKIQKFAIVGDKIFLSGFVFLPKN